MPYPGQFYRLVAIGTLYDDIFNFTLSMVPTALGEISIPAVTPAIAEDAGQVVEAWWTNSTVGERPEISSRAILTSVKFNRIGPDGRYVDAEPQEYILPAPVAGTSSAQEAAQLATAVTLRTAVARGRGSKGRFFLPPNASMASLGTDGRITTTAAQNLADSAATLIRNLNAIGTLVTRVGVASDAGAGRFEHVTHVTVGRVIDTIRSRRSALDEDPAETTI